jgi:hypothetical protein
MPDIGLAWTMTDLWPWPDIPRFQKQSVFDLSSPLQCCRRARHQGCCPNSEPRRGFFRREGIGEPRGRLGAEGGLGGATDPRVHTGNAPDRPVFLLCHEQRLAQTKPRHGGGAAGGGARRTPGVKGGYKERGSVGAIPPTVLSSFSPYFDLVTLIVTEYRRPRSRRERAL